MEVNDRNEVRRGLLPREVRQAIESGWEAKQVTPTVEHICSAGCGRSYTCIPGDAQEDYLRSVGFTCLNCRRKAASWLKGHRGHLARAAKAAASS